MSTPLQDILAQRIRDNGPLNIGEFMAEALTHPQHGYYMDKDPFGRAGDFTTAPEISQMFGEMIGVWAADLWQLMGAPESFIWLECGPGRGTLSADALRATRHVPGFHEAAEIHLLEASPVLKKAQAQALAGFKPVWHETLETLPAGKPLILIANEFLDALPIRQMLKTAKGWEERVVATDIGGTGLVYASRDLTSEDRARIPTHITGTPEGTIFEFSPARDLFIKAVCRCLREHGGAALFIDYGYERSAPGETLQAVRAHEYVPVLSKPGESDISAHVDFGQLLRTARDSGVHTLGPVPQGRFLQTLGIGLRAQTLAQKASSVQREELEKALHRLTDSAQMGALFKVAGLYYGTKTVPTGF
ncbi:MAG: SAM-dependent methyltransferase [Alphaproteobacteria bacterium]|nr:SAM-dependent methyltransferase [Alphaproteobacteria bacterium]